MSYYFKVSIANKNIEINCLNRSVFVECKSFLSEFDVPDVIVSTSLKELEEEASYLPPINESNYDGVTTSRFYGHLESIVVHRKIAESMLSFDTFLMHGAVVALDNKAYMFTAASGVGKTTRLIKWLECYPDSVVVNGDKPLIRITNTEAIACGTPWCGKEGLGSTIMVPLRAIFVLERAEDGEENSIEEISFFNAFPYLLKQTHYPVDPNLAKKTISLLNALKGKVKIYRFRSSPTQEAVQLAYETANPLDY